MAPIIQTIINSSWFRDAKDDSVVHPEFSDGGKLSLVTLAFVLTVVRLWLTRKTFSLICLFRLKTVLMNGPRDHARKSSCRKTSTRRSTRLTSRDWKISRTRQPNMTLSPDFSSICSRMHGRMDFFAAFILAFTQFLPYQETRQRRWHISSQGSQSIRRWSWKGKDGMGHPSVLWQWGHQWVILYNSSYNVYIKWFYNPTPSSILAIQSI